MASDVGVDSSGVAARIREVRTSLGLNQTDFARELNVSRSHISEVENKTVKIPIDLIFSIKNRFGNETEKANLNWILTGDLRKVPWGPRPESSPLSSILGLDSRALSSALLVLLKWQKERILSENINEISIIFRQLLYVYVSTLERATQSGLDIAESRKIASEAMQKLFHSLLNEELTLELGIDPSKGGPDA